jgi:hypothetical protein
MSEYQYYEFRAIDRALTAGQKQAVSSLSSRARVTSHMASFVYHYGDFRGKPEQLMTDFFDAMLYMTNWGSRRLMFRIPAALIDMKQTGLYCISDEIDRRLTSDRTCVLVDFDFNDENLMEWTEGEGWMDELVDLRENLIQGDWRVFYLAWLKAMPGMLSMGDIPDDMIEPPVPAGLKQLTPELKAFVEFLDIDTVLLEAAAENSETFLEKSPDLEAWIDKLPAAEQHDFLVRLSRGEEGLSILLNRRLLQIADKTHPESKLAEKQLRTVATLVKAAEDLQQQKKETARIQAEAERQRKLEALAARKNAVWQEIERLIAEKKSKSYDEAAKLLQSLRELAEYQDDLPRFRQRIENLQQTYSNRPAMLDRIKRAKLIS